MISMFIATIRSWKIYAYDLSSWSVKQHGLYPPSAAIVRPRFYCKQFEWRQKMLNAKICQGKEWDFGTFHAYFRIYSSSPKRGLLILTCHSCWRGVPFEKIHVKTHIRWSSIWKRNWFATAWFNISALWFEVTPFLTTSLCRLLQVAYLDDRVGPLGLCILVVGCLITIFGIGLFDLIKDMREEAAL